jgi:hypothetical protein
VLLAAEVPTAAAQAGSPCGPDLPIKCTPGKSAAILSAFVGAGIVAAYLGIVSTIQGMKRRLLAVPRSPTEG